MDRCPYCPHSWHGLPCKLRTWLNSDPSCPCRGSITPSELEELQNVDV